MIKTAVAIRHINFEDLGIFETTLEAAGYKVRYFDVGIHDLCMIDPIKTDLIIFLGGPIGVNQITSYPILEAEMNILAERLSRKLPTIGICLGAQLIAKMLGANILPMKSKEIGFSKINLTEKGNASPLRHIADVPVLHWHGDMFEIPNQADCLAQTTICPNQAFSLGPNILGLQFHPEVDVTFNIERWLIGHAAELHAANIAPEEIRKEALKTMPGHIKAAQKMLVEWLKRIET